MILKISVPLHFTAKLEYNEHDYYSEFMNVPAKFLYAPIENCHT